MSQQEENALISELLSLMERAQPLFVPPTSVSGTEHMMRLVFAALVVTLLQDSELAYQDQESDQE